MTMKHDPDSTLGRRDFLFALAGSVAAAGAPLPRGWPQVPNVVRISVDFAIPNIDHTMIMLLERTDKMIREMTDVYRYPRLTGPIRATPDS